MSIPVALRKESVDRNMSRKNLINGICLVALRKESVDRNYIGRFLKCCFVMSLSARRAWIEIRQRTCQQDEKRVALRKESVDRNFLDMNTISSTTASLSARRAWIEITTQTARNTSIAVALRKESVDRNSFGLSCADKVSRRSPQGERG